jgi:RNAse (barnase) inhibitor barstar
MADSLFDILAAKDFDEPLEMQAIKHYVRGHFDEVVEVIVREQEVIITCPSAALAGTLRFHVRQLQQTARTSKRILFRIR